MGGRPMGRKAMKHNPILEGEQHGIAWVEPDGTAGTEREKYAYRVSGLHSAAALKLGSLPIGSICFGYTVNKAKCGRLTFKVWTVYRSVNSLYSYTMQPITDDDFLVKEMKAIESLSDDIVANIVGEQNGILPDKVPAETDAASTN